MCKPLLRNIIPATYHAEKYLSLWNYRTYLFSERSHMQQEGAGLPTNPNINHVINDFKCCRGALCPERSPAGTWTSRTSWTSWLTRASPSGWHRPNWWWRRCGYLDFSQNRNSLKVIRDGFLYESDYLFSGSGVVQERDGRGEHVSRRRDQQEGHQAATNRCDQRLKLLPLMWGGAKDFIQK